MPRGAVAWRGFLARFGPTHRRAPAGVHGAKRGAKGGRRNQSVMRRPRQRARQAEQDGKQAFRFVRTWETVTPVKREHSKEVSWVSECPGEAAGRVRAASARPGKRNEFRSTRRPSREANRSQGCCALRGRIVPLGAGGCRNATTAAGAELGNLSHVSVNMENVAVTARCARRRGCERTPRLRRDHRHGNLRPSSGAIWQSRPTGARPAASAGVDGED